MKVSRRIICVSIAVSALAVSAQAFDGQQYDEKAFAAMQEAGKPIVVEVHAGWCPVCWKQGPIVSALLNKPEMKGFERITVEYDMEKDVLKRFNVTKQSTMIVFKGKTEVGRSIGDTDPVRIETMLRSAL